MPASYGMNPEDGVVINQAPRKRNRTAGGRLNPLSTAVLDP